MPEKSQKAAIGVFDSGFGGLDILREIVKLMPEYDYIYLGDSARAPYGSRSQELIYQFTEQAIGFLFQKGCPLIVVACNTASSEALRKIQQDYLRKHYPENRVLGVLIPAAEEAVKLSKNNKIGVIATEGTVASKAFERELKKLKPEVEVFEAACPLLVPIVEAGEQDSKIAELALKKYLKPLIKKNIDALILGCTHYGLLKDKIREIVPEHIKLVSEGRVVAEKLRDYLKRHPEIETKISKAGKIEFLTTDLTKNFQKLGERFFKHPIKAKNISL